MATEPTMEVSVRDAMVPVPEGQSFFRALQSVGASAIEMSTEPGYGLPALVLEDGSAPFSIHTPEAIQALRQRLDAEGVRVAALFVANDFSGDDAEAHVAWVADVTRAARELGAPALRIDTWTRRSDLPKTAIRDNLARRLGQVLEQTADTGVALGIENHGAIFNDPQLLDEVFAAVGDARLGMTLDTGNFYWYGYPLSEVYAILAHFAPRTKHTHVKNIAYPPELRETRRAIGYEYGRYAAPLDEGNIDMRRVVALLRDAGYTGDLCVEDESLSRFPSEERANVLRRDVQTLRAALAEGQGNE